MWDDSLKDEQPDPGGSAASHAASDSPWIASLDPASLEPEPPPQSEAPGLFTPQPESRHPYRFPHIGHAFLFFIIALLAVVFAQVAGVFVLELVHLSGHRNLYSTYMFAATDARASIPIQAFAYGILVLVSIPVFSVLWNEPFWAGVRWNSVFARRRWILLAILGLAIGFGISFLGDHLPMPQNPPITRDMMKSATGAWLMLLFGVTAAPIVEELGFRGFLLPGLINCFRWCSDRNVLPESVARWVGIPISIILTSIAFALMHSPQVSHAWGPLVLIGAVSVVLCVVRLWGNSVAASVILHAAYNFTLFVGVLYQTDGFRHLQRLTG